MSQAGKSGGRKAQKQGSKIQAQADKAQQHKGLSEVALLGSLWVVEHVRDALDPMVVLYDPKTLDMLPESIVVEHWNLLDAAITEAKKFYARKTTRHERWETLIMGLTEAKAWMESCQHVMKARKLGGGWYDVPDMTLKQSYGRLDTYIKQ